jgi:lysine biosynthesis protein LysW
MTAAVLCPDCGNRLKLGAHPRAGQRKVCPDCDTRLEIVSASPLILDIYDINRPSPRKIPGKKTVAESFCPECEHPLRLGSHPREGQQVMCPECRTHLEVVSLDPLELDTPIAVWKRGSR